MSHSTIVTVERQRSNEEKELRMGYCEVGSMRLKEFMEDSLRRTGSQIRESTREEYESAMKDFISVVGNMDFRAVSLKHGELYRQTCLDRDNSKATVAKKLRHLKHLFELAVNRKHLDENPLKYVKAPKSPRKKVEIFKADECERLLKAAVDSLENADLRWDLLIVTALATGMRRGASSSPLPDTTTFRNSEEKTNGLSLMPG